MTRLTYLATLLALCATMTSTACSVVLDERDDADAAPTGDDGTAGDTLTFQGKACSSLRGTRTLPSWMGNQSVDVYPRSLFSFALDSTDYDVVRNDGDLLYTFNMFAVSMVTDDRSFIVDLGDVPLTDVPPSVNPDDFPAGNWDAHDDIQAVLNHTYLVRNVDSDAAQWAAFRVVGLAPASKVTFDWILSPDPDEMVVPTPCL